MFSFKFSLIILDEIHVWLYLLLMWDYLWVDVAVKCLFASLFSPLYKLICVGAQWTGIVTTIAIEMLKTGMVEAVICVQR